MLRQRQNHREHLNGSVFAGAIRTKMVKSDAVAVNPGSWSIPFEEQDASEVKSSAKHRRIGKGGGHLRRDNDRSDCRSSTSSTFRGLRTAAVPLRQSTREQHFGGQCGTLQILQRRPDSNGTHVPLRHVSVVASINMFAADVTLTQVFVNREENPIEAIYVFPIEVSDPGTCPSGGMRGTQIERCLCRRMRLFIRSRPRSAIERLPLCSKRRKQQSRSTLRPSHRVKPR